MGRFDPDDQEIIFPLSQKTSTTRVEHDPNGLSANEPGAKLDHGKVMADLVIGDFTRALEAVAEVGTFGAHKYSPHGWISVPNGINRYADAGMRHYLKRKKGELIDPDSRCLHLAQEAWNKLAELELTLIEMNNTAKE